MLLFEVAASVRAQIVADFGYLEVAAVHAALQLGSKTQQDVDDHVTRQLAAGASVGTVKQLRRLLPPVFFSEKKFEAALVDILGVGITRESAQRLFRLLNYDQQGLVELRALLDVDRCALKAWCNEAGGGVMDDAVPAETRQGQVSRVSPGVSRVHGTSLRPCVDASVPGQVFEAESDRSHADSGRQQTARTSGGRTGSTRGELRSHSPSSNRSHLLSRGRSSSPTRSQRGPARSQRARAKSPVWGNQETALLSLVAFRDEVEARQLENPQPPTPTPQWRENKPPGCEASVHAVKVYVAMPKSKGTPNSPILESRSGALSVPVAVGEHLVNASSTSCPSSTAPRGCWDFSNTMGSPTGSGVSASVETPTSVSSRQSSLTQSPTVNVRQHVRRGGSSSLPRFGDKDVPRRVSSGTTGSFSRSKDCWSSKTGTAGRRRPATHRSL